MYHRALRFAGIGAFAVVILLSSSQAFAADSSPLPLSLAPTRAVPEGVKISLHFLTDAVAAGAFPTLAHQAEFEVRAVDSTGKPRTGVEVDLPVVIKGGKGPTEAIAARAIWAALSARPGHTTALTGKDGIARGIFTSGNRADETVVLQVPGTEAKAEIRQLWDDCGQFYDSTYGPEGNLIRVRYNLRLSRTVVGPDGKPTQVSIPITGHPMTLKLIDMPMSFLNQELGPDENGDGNPDGEYQERKISSKDVDLTEWKHLQQYVEISKVTEVEPGIYEGTIEFTPPKNEKGNQIFTVTDPTRRIIDDSVYKSDGS
jgi:hypothetical protein